MSGNHALIFGASGITGWAITNQMCLGYPDESTFSQVTALTNRPLAAEQALWPASKKLQVVSGLDLLTDKGLASLEADMKQKVKGIETVTHVYFFAYIMDPDHEKETAINVKLLERAVLSVEHLSPKLKFVLLPTGTKAYGVHLLNDMPFTPPLKESLPRLPEPHASQIFYYALTDKVVELEKSKSWQYCEVMPDNIIGFVPNNNIYCLAQTLATYLALYVAVEGKGAKCPFPGNEKSWIIKSNESSQDIVAKFCIYASLHPEKTTGERYNCADSSTPGSWSIKWPVICEYFGLVGTPPPAGGSGPQPGQYVKEHMDVWKKLEKEHGLVTGRQIGEVASGFQYFIMTLFDFDRHMDMSKMQNAWGDKNEEVDTKGSWWVTLDRFRKAKIIP